MSSVDNHDAVPEVIFRKFRIHQWRHSLTILANAHRKEWTDIISVLSDFTLTATEILTPGGRKSPIAGALDERLYELGWEERKFDTKIVVDDKVYETPTHSVDCFKNGVALEVEWNNKDPFYDRDLNNFRLLFDLNAIEIGVIVTRTSELQNIFKTLGKASSYGASTTHLSKLIPRIDGGGGGGCPILVFAIGKEAFVDDR